MSERGELGAVLAAEMARWESAGLRRRLDVPPNGADFTSNDYLGLATHPAVVEGARAAAALHGAGGRASRLLGGGSPIDVETELAAARWTGSEAALLFPSGYQANIGAIGALVDKGDAIVSDQLNHASLIDAARLTHAQVLVYRHGDPEDAERCVRLASGARRVLLVTESVFSMDGDLAPLGDLADVCRRHRAWILVDEAHAIGVLGDQGAGAWSEHCDPRDPTLAARIVTGGKALGVAGAFVLGRARLREHLANRARSFVFTTGTPPAVSGGLHAAIGVCRQSEDRRRAARRNAERVAEALGLPRPSATIVPVLLGASDVALAAAKACADAGLDVRAIRPPTVPEGTSRLRVSCHSFNTEGEIARLVDTVSPFLEELRVAASPERAARPQAIFVAGTGTDVGKTVVSALLCRASARRSPTVYWKAVQTGTDSDSYTTLNLTELDGEEVLQPGYEFAKPASPHEAAAEEGAAIDPARLRSLLAAHLKRLGTGNLILELAGGLLVPLTDSYTQIDWLARERAPFVLVARSELGTLNHTLLSLEAARARGLEPRALFLVGKPHPSNRETLHRMGRVAAVYEVPPFDPLDGPALERWLLDHDLAPVFRSVRPMHG